jgi:hypothetical protein
MYRFRIGDTVVTAKGQIRAIIDRKNGRYLFMELRDTSYNGKGIPRGTQSSQAAPAFEKENSFIDLTIHCLKIYE